MTFVVDFLTIKSLGVKVICESDGSSCNAKFSEPIYCPGAIVDGREDSNSNVDETVVGFNFMGASTANYFPQGLEKFFPKLSQMAFQKGRLKRIQEQDLRMLGGLEHLDLSENDLEALEVDVFKNNRGLKAIVLNYNNLKFIRAATFDSLVLYYISMLGPQCITGDFDTIENVTIAKISLEEKCSDTGALQSLKFIPPSCAKEEKNTEDLRKFKIQITVIGLVVVAFFAILFTAIAICINRNVQRIGTELHEVQVAVKDVNLKLQKLAQAVKSAQIRGAPYEIPLSVDENIYQDIEYFQHSL